MSTLVLRTVTKAFGAKKVVSDVSLDVRSGEFLSILGPSGCGKTTLLRLIAGFESLSSGSISVAGKDLGGLPARERGIGMVFQNYALFPHMTVFENVAFGLESRGLQREEIRRRVKEILDTVGLRGRDGAPVPTLSGGEQQRVAVARALVVRPSVLLMDEPLSNLDVTLRQSTREEVRAIQRKTGITTVYVTHDQAEAMSLSDRIAVMNAGRVAQIGSPAEVYRLPATPFVASFVGGALLLEGEVTPSGDSVRIGGPAFDVSRSGPAFPPGRGLFAIPSEAVVLSREEGGNTRHAEIVGREYLGFSTALTLRDGDLVLRSVQLSGTLVEEFSPGTSVAYAIEWSRCTFFRERT